MLKDKIKITHGELPIAAEEDLLQVRKVIREIVAGLEFTLTDATRIVTAASELARNIYLYAGVGKLEWKIINNQMGNAGIELFFSDQGPGISNIEQALTEGFSTGKGLGLGLPGAKRLMDHMDITSEPGRGTQIKVIKWLRK